LPARQQLTPEALGREEDAGVSRCFNRVGVSFFRFLVFTLFLGQFGFSAFFALSLFYRFSWDYCFGLARLGFFLFYRWPVWFLSLVA
jgi:hypothetical protein